MHERALTIGSTLGAGRYELDEQLGCGGMGWVFRGFDRVLQRQALAIKIFYPHCVRTEQVIERFRAETLIARKLSHPNIVQTYNFHRDDPQCTYTTMELVSGKSLRDWLAEEQEDRATKALSLLLQLASGMGYAHQSGVVHGDLKPENLLLSGETLKIADFGIARLINVDEKTGVHGIAGTPRYMSPEQLMGRVLRPESDVYSFGIVAYELLFGKPPFTGASLYELAELHLTSPLRFPPDAARIAPRWSLDLIARCTTKHEHERYGSLKEVETTIRRELGAGRDEALEPARQIAAQERVTRAYLPEVATEVKPFFNRMLALAVGATIFPLAMYLLGGDVGWAIGGVLLGVLTASLFLFGRMLPIVVCLCAALGLAALARFNPATNKRAAALLLALEEKQGIELESMKDLLGIRLSASEPSSLIDAASDATALWALLHSGIHLDIRDHRGRTLIHAAVEKGRRHEIDALVDGGAKINSRDRDGSTPLHLAVRAHHSATVEAVLARGADPNMKNKRGETPLSIVVRQGQHAIAALLLDQGADPDTTIGTERTPLLNRIVRNQDVHMLGLFLSAGANPNVRSELGETPLHVAVRANARGRTFSEVLTTLLAHGADPLAANHRGRTPALEAAERGVILPPRK